MRVVLVQPHTDQPVTGGYLYNARMLAHAGGRLVSVRGLAELAPGAHPCEVLLLDSLWLGAPEAVATARRAAPGARVAWLLHGLPSMFGAGAEPAAGPSAAERAALAAADGIVVPGGWLAGLHPRAFVCPPGVDPAFAAVGAAAPPPALPPAPPLVLTVATVAAVKGHDLLLEALRRAGVPCRWRLVGAVAEPDFAATLRAQAAAAGVPLELAGPVAPADVPAELARAALFVLASRSENSPLSLREALAAGVPVVASEVGGVGELVRDGVDGILCRPGDVGGLAQALARVLGDAGVRAALARHARTRTFPDWPAAAATFTAAVRALAAA
jgi:glycosyltransferase involved in cell wall biosynthesis